MKKNKFSKRLIAMLAVISMIFVNLLGSGISAKAESTSGQPVFEETECRRLLIGESYDFDIKDAPSQATYQWKSSNKAIATVDQDGVVKAVAKGNVTITCKITSGEDTTTLKAKVFVKKPSKNPATKVWVNNKVQAMAPEETYDLNCTYRPANAADFVNWTSSDPSIAKVNAYGVVTALQKGKVTIQATTLNKAVSYKITIKVSETVTVTSQKQLNQALKAGKASKIYISSKKALELTIAKGDYSAQELVVNAPNATVKNYGVFKSIEIRTLKDKGWSEEVAGNKFTGKFVVTTPTPTPAASCQSGSGSQGGSSNPPSPSTPTATPVPATPTPTPAVKVDTKVDEKGFTADGRIVASYGTPRIDGKIDDVWSKAVEIQAPHINNAAVKATATFKLLWDDNAVYVLAQVKDPNMTLEPGQAHEKDSIEVFLDELNDKGTSYAFDDLQFRVNYDNIQSAGNGDLSRFYTATKTGEGEYIIEARVELLMNFAANDVIYGMELQVNDGIGSSRAGTITLFDTTDSAWSKPSVFGEVVLTGKEPGDVPGLNPYNLIKLIASAENMDVACPALAENLKEAKDVIANEASTQQEIDKAYEALNTVITFINAVTKAANMDLSVYQENGLDVVKTAIEDAEKLLAKEGATFDEMKAAIDALDKAVAALKIKGLDDNGNIAAKFGSPVIDGKVDEVWDKVDYVPATPSGSGSTDTTAKYKVLWDDKALYVLADVTDSALDVTSGTVYNRDCVEIFLDEGNNAIENIFDLDDRHYRISCENSLSADRGSLDLLYTEVAKKTDAEGKVTGYILEARIALQNPAQSKNIYGMELQLNDAMGGNRTGTLNVFDKTSSAYASPTLFGKVVLNEKSDGDVIGFNPYDLKKMVGIANDIQLARYTDDTAAVVKDLVAKADAAITAGDQAQVDTLCVSLDQAIKALVHKEIKDVDPEVSKLKEFRRIPAEYLTGAAYDDKEKGTVVREFYDTYEYSDDGIKGNAVKKDMLVYLPAGYDAEDKNTKYNVLYLIHGTSENQNTVFGDSDPNVTTVMKKVLDKMIANGELDPMIVVTPGYQGMESGRLQYEIVNEILPYVAAKYNTYSASGSAEDLKAARNHRAVGGFSQGSACTFTIMKSCFDYFKYYLPVSGGPGSADFASVVKGYGLKDYYVFASTGTDDIAYSGMVNAIPAMADQKDSEGNPLFIYNADLSVGNLYLVLLKDGTHTWQCVNQYLYNILPDVFFAEKGTDAPVIAADENGFTADGKIVGTFGTPKIDGVIDDVWSKAVEIKPPHTNNAAVQATATFKVLWDDDALYFLAQVKDPNMSVAPSNNYEQDSFEVFLDENNDKTKAYGTDDLHFRVNYDNVQSYDKGDGTRFYTATMKGENEYLVEGRVELQNAAKNGTIYGIELQINDGIGTSRVGTITAFDTTDGAWDNTALFGEIVLTGKKPGDVPGMNPYKLMSLVASADSFDVSAFTKGVGAFTASVDAAKAALTNATTKDEIDTAYNALNDVMSFMGVIKKYASMNLDSFNGGEAVKNAVSAAEDILAKADATPEEMILAGSALNAAIVDLGTYSLKDVYEDKFYIGAAVHLNGLADETYTNNLLSQYNSITCENDMKPEVVLDQAATKAAGEVVCNFTNMDQYCDYAAAHGLKMRGHTFVWHSQTPAWFFKEGFDDNGAFVDVATMDLRLQQFMNQVFGHIKDKNYTDLFYAYDVCNEVVSSMSMGSNWKTVYGDYSFVTKAFQFAREASLGTNIKLFYNDYNCYDDGKAEKILDLVADAKAAGNIDGIGMQSHVNTEFPSMDQYRATLAKFVAAGFDVQITELDIATAIDGNGSAPDAAKAAKQAQIYKDLFQIYVDYKDNISSVTLWGINDQHSWRGTQDPLVYDRQYKEKDSYWNIISVGLAADNAPAATFAVAVPEVPEVPAEIVAEPEVPETPVDTDVEPEVAEQPLDSVA